MLITDKMAYLKHVDYGQDGLPQHVDYEQDDLLQHVDYGQDGLPPTC